MIAAEVLPNVCEHNAVWLKQFLQEHKGPLKSEDLATYLSGSCKNCPEANDDAVMVSAKLKEHMLNRIDRREMLELFFKTDTYESLMETEDERASREAAKEEEPTKETKAPSDVIDPKQQAAPTDKQPLNVSEINIERRAALEKERQEALTGLVNNQNSAAKHNRLIKGDQMIKVEEPLLTILNSFQTHLNAPQLDSNDFEFLSMQEQFIEWLEYQGFNPKVTAGAWQAAWSSAHEKVGNETMDIAVGSDGQIEVMSIIEDTANKELVFLMIFYLMRGTNMEKACKKMKGDFAKLVRRKKKLLGLKDMVEQKWRVQHILNLTEYKETSVLLKQCINSIDLICRNDRNDFCSYFNHATQNLLTDMETDISKTKYAKRE